MWKLTGAGMIQELRELKDKAGTVWKTILKVAMMGGVVEVVIPPGFDRAKLPAAGTAVKVSAHLQAGFKGQLDFVAESVVAG